MNVHERWAVTLKRNKQVEAESYCALTPVIQSAISSSSKRSVSIFIAGKSVVGQWKRQLFSVSVKNLTATDNLIHLGFCKPWGGPECSKTTLERGQSLFALQVPFSCGFIQDMDSDPQVSFCMNRANNHVVYHKRSLCMIDFGMWNHYWRYLISFWKMNRVLLSLTSLL